MKELRTAFLADAPRRIQNLRQDINRLRAADSVNREIVQQTFRQLHTLKGSAAAFDFSAVSRIAHELENFLEIISPQNFAESLAVLEEGVGEIEAAFSEAQETFTEKSEQKIENWRTVYQNVLENKVENAPEIVLPFDLENQLSAAEAERLRQALKQNSNLAVISADFAAASFAESFYSLQNKLNASGEVVATLPDVENTKNGKIALRLIFVGSKSEEKLAKVLKDSNTKITAFSENKIVCDNDSSGQKRKVKLADLWAQAALAGKKVAAAQGKQVFFREREIDGIEIEPERTEACEIALLHIARNAVAHGIEAPHERAGNGKNESGTVCLETWLDKNEFCLQITDDGRGIDRAKILKTARERNLLVENGTATEPTAEQIIFLAGFSTADAVTEDSGRGVGLDAVETSVRAANGAIEMSSETGRGTKFLIRFRNINEIF
jgi:two-component system chemotaxis sensor kinase CheA